MPNYRRAFIPGGTYFFTVNLLQRHDNNLLIREIKLLREKVRQVRKRHPFYIEAWVVIPDHFIVCEHYRPMIAILVCVGV